ncbi:MAG: hypothetical protein IKC76_03775, partial [Firmicutes bacterium]|nr:hypothetical protein [Bacillota bacterium]
MWLLLIEPRGYSVLMLGKLKQPPGGGRIRKQRDYPKGYKQKLPDETSGLLLIEPARLLTPVSRIKKPHPGGWG